MKLWRKTSVQAVEHLKAYIDSVLNWHFEGAVDGATAKLLLWDEVQRTMYGKGEWARVAWFRIASVGDVALAISVVESQGNVLSVYCVGARKPSLVAEAVATAPAQEVLYITAKLGSAVDAARTVAELQLRGFEVRDWWFGAPR